jgi:hypothetical protein
VARPDRTELLVAGARFALDSLSDTTLDDIRTPSRLIARGPRALTKAVLFPVRFLYTAVTGQAGLNSVAAEHYVATPGVPAAGLVTAALGWRTRPPADPAAATALAAREIIPLYIHYIDDHIARLGALPHDDLASRFRQWRSRLLA